ncbi:hypothetical protein EV421DRAFT_2023304 [Armillaria borealis]|uniref:Uncharacterized protein n=1 Tax=Armillaria borealis TaxID=47425 RepID=A0AA39J1H2_9AGAR|nr:hypothetical protein EV421DRAFT_2023304 [Armillaria borealis]
MSYLSILNGVASVRIHLCSIVSTVRAAINGSRDGVGSGIDQNNTTIELPESPEVILDQNQNHISQDVGPVLEVRSDFPPNRPSGMESPSETSIVSEILVNPVAPIKVQPTESKYLAAHPQVTLSAATEIGRMESLVKVPSQRRYTGEFVIPSSLADTPHACLGVTRLLAQLNIILGTSYTLDMPSLSSLLEACIANDYDFRTACGRRHPNAEIRGNEVTGCTTTNDAECMEVCHALDIHINIIVCSFDRPLPTLLRFRRISSTTAEPKLAFSSTRVSIVLMGSVSTSDPRQDAEYQQRLHGRVAMVAPFSSASSQCADDVLREGAEVGGSRHGKVRTDDDARIGRYIRQRRIYAAGFGARRGSYERRLCIVLIEVEKTLEMIWQDKRGPRRGRFDDRLAARGKDRTHRKNRQWQMAGLSLESGLGDVNADVGSRDLQVFHWGHEVRRRSSARLGGADAQMLGIEGGIRMNTRLDQYRSMGCKSGWEIQGRSQEKFDGTCKEAMSQI